MGGARRSIIHGPVLSVDLHDVRFPAQDPTRVKCCIWLYCPMQKSIERLFLLSNVKTELSCFKGISMFLPHFVYAVQEKIQRPASALCAWLDYWNGGAIVKAFTRMNQISWVFLSRFVQPCFMATNTVIFRPIAKAMQLFWAVSEGRRAAWSRWDRVFSGAEHGLGSGSLDFHCGSGLVTVRILCGEFEKSTLLTHSLHKISISKALRSFLKTRVSS